MLRLSDIRMKPKLVRLLLLVGPIPTRSRFSVAIHVDSP